MTESIAGYYEIDLISAPPDSDSAYSFIKIGPYGRGNAQFDGNNSTVFGSLRLYDSYHGPQVRIHVCMYMKCG